MAEFQELIKNFNKCRDYVRDFFVYGFKSRQDFTSDKKSARTYDDERRRITSWLYEYVAEDITETDKAINRVKNISLQIDSNLLDTNPLFAVWKTKSFTDNDILLHFYLLDILGGYLTSPACRRTMTADSKQLSSEPIYPAYSASELADILSKEYSFPADTQLVRRKCNEYVREGLLETVKNGKTLLYRAGLTWNGLFPQSAAIPSDSYNSGKISNSQFHSGNEEASLIDAISFMQLVCPFGYIGNTILERLEKDNKVFRIKHSFPAFTLEEEIAYKLISAKKDHSYAKMDIMSNKSAQVLRPLYGVPLKIFVSTRTGRRYVCIYRMLHERAQTANNEPLTPKFHFRCIRLDQIKAVTIISPEDVSGKKRTALNYTMEAFEVQEMALNKNLPLVWGVSFEGQRTKLVLTLHIDERWEEFILERLNREGKGGIVTKVCENTFCYEKIVFDANEMFPWLRTFIGRIEDIHFYSIDHEGREGAENRTLQKLFMNDIDSLYQMYEI